jgi:ribonuclease HII
VAKAVLGVVVAVTCLMSVVFSTMAAVNDSKKLSAMDSIKDVLTTQDHSI